MRCLLPNKMAFKMLGWLSLTRLPSTLLARAPLAPMAQVARWVAVGCPFGGAPGWVVDGLCTGVQFGGSLGDMFFVQRSTFRQAACQSPSVFELLPPLDFQFAQPPPTLTLWLKTPLEGNRAEGAGADASLRRVAHTAFTVHPAPQAAQGGAAGVHDAHAAAPQLPRLSLAPPSGTDAGGAAAVGSGNEAHQYVFQLNALPSLLTRVLKDNAGQCCGTAPAGHLHHLTIAPLRCCSECGRRQRAAPLQPRAVGRRASQPCGLEVCQAAALLLLLQPLWRRAEHALQRGVRSMVVPGAGKTCKVCSGTAVSIAQTALSLQQPDLAPARQCALPCLVQHEQEQYHPPVTLSSVRLSLSTCVPQDAEAVPHASASFSHVDGDGTVPAESATAHGFAAAGEQSVAGAHRDLVGMQTVWDQMLNWLRQPEQVEMRERAGGAGQEASGRAGPAADEQCDFWNPLLWQPLLQG